MQSKTNNDEIKDENDLTVLNFADIISGTPNYTVTIDETAPVIWYTYPLELE